MRDRNDFARRVAECTARGFLLSSLETKKPLRSNLVEKGREAFLLDPIARLGIKDK